jgi:hypothetical protein
MGKMTGESILGVVGGILGIIVGVFIYYLGTFGLGDIPAELAGMLLILLGILGFVGGLVVGRYRSTGGVIMIIAGILGFFVLFALWIIPGIIMIVGGALSFKKPKPLGEVKVEGSKGIV